MMDSRELRIGNWVNYSFTDKKELASHVQINAEHFSEFNEGSFFEPIPLAKEWLLKFGFFEWKGWYYLSLKKLGEDFTMCYIPMENLLMLNIKDKSIKYENPKVHQIQNLYFALYIEELILTK